MFISVISDVYFSIWDLISSRSQMSAFPDRVVISSKAEKVEKVKRSTIEKIFSDDLKTANR